MNKKGWKDRAIENYNQFIGLWKNCDPKSHHLTDDAAKRVQEPGI